MDARFFTADGSRVMITEADLGNLLADAIDEALAADDRDGTARGARMAAKVFAGRVGIGHVLAEGHDRATCGYCAAALGHICLCGRSFDTKWGLRVHMRSCRIERARSAAWVAAAEQGRDPIAAGDAAVREALAAQR
jgi:hypothetical protein